MHGNAQAGAVTFFGFLSFFPILALAFFAVGVLAQVYPELRSDIRVEIENLFPGVVGGDEGEIPLKTFEDFGATLGIVGALGLLYSGLGWLGAMRDALEAVFLLPRREKPNLVVGKLRDMGTLVLLGLVLIVSVALSGPSRASRSGCSDGSGSTLTRRRPTCCCWCCRTGWPSPPRRCC